MPAGGEEFDESGKVVLKSEHGIDHDLETYTTPRKVGTGRGHSVNGTEIWLLDNEGLMTCIRDAPLDAVTIWQ